MGAYVGDAGSVRPSLRVSAVLVDGLSMILAPCGRRRRIPALIWSPSVLMAGAMLRARRKCTVCVDEALGFMAQSARRERAVVCPMAPAASHVFLVWMGRVCSKCTGRFARWPDTEHARQGGHTRSLVLNGLGQWQRGALGAALEEAGALWVLPEVLAHHGFGVELEGSALVHPEARTPGHSWRKRRWPHCILPCLSGTLPISMHRKHSGCKPPKKIEKRCQKLLKNE